MVELGEVGLCYITITSQCMPSGGPVVVLGVPDTPGYLLPPLGINASPSDHGFEGKGGPTPYYVCGHNVMTHWCIFLI